jgi:dihydrofolate reductase
VSERTAEAEEVALELSAYVAISLDGYIARADGSMDWLRGGGPRPPEEAARYRAFIDSVDAIVLGRATYEAVRDLPVWPYPAKPVVVLGSAPSGVPSTHPDAVEHMTGAPADLLPRFGARGWSHLYVDGGNTIQRFLAAGLVHRLVLNRVPVLLGTGIPLFGPLPADVWLQHVSTVAYPGGLVQSEYHVRGA